VLGWPRSAGMQQQQQRLACPVLQSAFLPSLAGAQAVVPLQDPAGEAQQQPTTRGPGMFSGVWLLPGVLEQPLFAVSAESCVTALLR
jgi:hypothetical protein